MSVSREEASHGAHQALQLQQKPPRCHPRSSCERSRHSSHAAVFLTLGLRCATQFREVHSRQGVFAKASQVRRTDSFRVAETEITRAVMELGPIRAVDTDGNIDSRRARVAMSADVINAPVEYPSARLGSPCGRRLTGFVDPLLANARFGRVELTTF